VRKLGASPGYLKAILGKRKKLGFKQIQKVALLFELNSFERDYFSVQAIRCLLEESDLCRYFDGILIRMKYLELSPRAEGEKSTDSTPLSNWLYGTILELSHLKGFCPKPDWIRKHLIDSESVSEAEILEAISYLSETKWIEQSQDGRWKVSTVNTIQMDPFLPSGMKVMNLPALKKSIEILEDPEKYAPNSFFTATAALDEKKRESTCRTLC
jgi:Domain of unknown function (DUF4423)